MSEVKEPMRCHFPVYQGEATAIYPGMLEQYKERVARELAVYGLQPYGEAEVRGVVMPDNPMGGHMVLSWRIMELPQ